ncbi:MAG: hypothetical protein ABI777_00035 [Betaproteobacteria bacterium]
MNAPPITPAVRKNRRTLYLIALIAAAPAIASYTVYYFFPPDRRANYGELLPTHPAPALTGVAADGAPFAFSTLAGKWVLAMAAPAGCDAACIQALYATRQARTIQGREMERLVRVWFVTDDATIDPALLTEHPGLLVVRGRPEAWSRLNVGPDRMVLLDPLQNLVLAFPRNPDIKAMARDLSRLLKASRIG